MPLPPPFPHTHNTTASYRPTTLLWMLVSRAATRWAMAFWMDPSTYLSFSSTRPSTFFEIPVVWRGRRGRWGVYIGVVEWNGAVSRFMVWCGVRVGKDS